MEYDSDFVRIKNKKVFQENIKKIDNILTRTNSQPDYKKTRIDWNYLCDVTDENRYSAAYYVMGIALGIIDEGYITFPKWEDRMLRFLSFLNEYNYSYCSDKELQTIVDGAWNSYLFVGFKGEAVWYKAWKKLPFYKRWIINCTITKLVGWIALIMQAILALCVDFIFMFYIIIALIISTLLEQRKVYGSDFIYPLSMMFFNYIIQAFDFSIKNDFIFTLPHIQLLILNYSYVVFFLCILIFYINRHNKASFERASENELIINFNRY